MTIRHALYFCTTVLVRVVTQSGSTLSILIVGKFLGREAVATYSVCLAAIWLASIVFTNGIPVMLRRYLILQPEEPTLTLYNRCLAAMYRSRPHYLITAALLLGLAAYVHATVGAQAVLLLAFLVPLTFVVPILGLKAGYYKAVGQAIRASLSEPGSIHLGIAVLTLAAIALGLSELTAIFTFEFLVFLAVAVLVLVSVHRATRGVVSINSPVPQRKILGNNLMLFVLRNGFPLFFAAFMAAEDLGHFRQEERLFFLLLFFYSLFETLATKSIIQAIGNPDHRAVRRYFRRCLGVLFAMGLAVSMVMFAGLSNATLADFIGYQRTGELIVFMAFAMPFYFVTYFNNLVLNLIGLHGKVILSLLFGAVAFIAGAYLAYPAFEIDGVRTAYLCGGVASSGYSALIILAYYRRPA